MIPLLFFGTCGNTVEEPWEVETFTARDRVQQEERPIENSDEPLVAVEWADTETALSIVLPQEWIAWPGAPAAEVRLHLQYGGERTAQPRHQRLQLLLDF